MCMCLCQLYSTSPFGQQQVYSSNYKSFRATTSLFEQLQVFGQLHVLNSAYLWPLGNQRVWPWMNTRQMYVIKFSNAYSPHCTSLNLTTNYLSFQVKEIDVACTQAWDDQSFVIRCLIIYFYLSEIKLLGLRTVVEFL